MPYAKSVVDTNSKTLKLSHTRRIVSAQTSRGRPTEENFDTEENFLRNYDLSNSWNFRDFEEKAA